MTQNFMKPGRLAAVVLVVTLALGAWLVSGRMLRVQTIEVTGDAMVPNEEIIRLSGLKIGQAMLTVSEAAIRQGVEANRFLKVLSVSKVFPAKVVIGIENRYPLAALQHNGSYLLLDKNGYVITRQASLTFLDVPLLTGVEIPDALARADMCLTTGNGSEAMRAAYTALTEVSRQGIMDLMSELNCADLDNMYLVTIDGLQVMLGSVKDMNQKVTLARSVLAMMPKDFKTAGLLDVTALNKADYINEAAVQTLGLDITDSQSGLGGV